ncbi:MAG: hypothetical protein NTW19_00030 [Planctomycetota bacterium]|nr:hypothetical protein [Planctomycetota bacterium]
MSTLASAIQPALTGLNDAVRRFAAHRKRWALYAGAANFVLIAPGALLLWFLLDWIFGLPMWPLVIGFALVPLLALFALVKHVVLPALRPIRLEDEAILIESLHGRMDNQVIGAMQLGQKVVAAGPDERLGYSAELVAEMTRRAAAAVEQAKPTTLLDLTRARRQVIAAGVLALAIVVCLVAAPRAVSDRAARLADAWAGILDTIFPVELRVEPGDVAVIRGQPVTLGVQVVGARRRTAELIRVDAPTRSGKVAGNAAPDADKHSDAIALADGGRGSFEIAQTKGDFTYQFRYGGRLSPLHRVRVGDLPDLSAIHYELAYPAYTGVPSRTIVGRVPRLQALAATHVQVSLAASTDLHPDLCYVQWRDGSRQPLVVNGRFASFAFTVEQPERATLHLAGSLGKGFEMRQPVSFEVAVDRDQPPTVQVLLKNREMTMMAEEATNFAVNYLAEDDFGVSELALEYRIEGIDPLLGRAPRSGVVTRLVEPARDRVKGQFSEMFKALSPGLEPGDRVTITLSAKDNNTESGPSLGRSPPIQIVVVRPDLAGFKEQQFGFAGESALGGLRKVKRATNLLVDPERTVRKEDAQKVDRQDLKSRVGAEAFPSGSEDAVGDYFRLLSGEK